MVIELPKYMLIRSNIAELCLSVHVVCVFLCVHIVSLVCLCSIFCSMCVMYVCVICLYIHVVCVRCMCEGGV